MSLAQEVCNAIQARREGRLEAGAGGYPRNNPIASDLSECTRAMVLGITNWQDRPPFDPYVRARLDRGQWIEERVRAELADLGFKIRSERKPFEIKDKVGRVVLRGRLEGFIEWGKQEVPFECKSVDPNIFRSLHTLEDFQRYWYTRKWPLQVQAYLYANNMEEGIILLDDCLGHWRLIPVPIDYEALEKIISRCEETIEHVAAKTLPDFHLDPSVCRRCWCLNRVCFPPMAAQGLQMIEDPELERKLERLDELDPLHLEFDALDKEIKERFRGKDGVVIGEYLIQGKETIQHRKAQEPKTIVGWRTTITKLEVDHDE